MNIIYLHVWTITLGGLQANLISTFTQFTLFFKGRKIILENSQKRTISIFSLHYLLLSIGGCKAVKTTSFAERERLPLPLYKFNTSAWKHWPEQFFKTIIKAKFSTQMHSDDSKSIACRVMINHQLIVIMVLMQR